MTKVKALSYLEKAVEKGDKKSSKLWDTFTFYTSRVSLHGIVFAVDSKHTLNRSLWILILLGATAALTVQLYKYEALLVKNHLVVNLLFMYDIMLFLLVFDEVICLLTFVAGVL